MSQFPWPPGVRETIGAIWLGVKASVPDSCLAAADEKFTFAKNNNAKAENVEMNDIGNEGDPMGSEGQDGQVLRKRGASVDSSSTVGVEAEHDMITEWQAGWNVTNAIQVTNKFMYLINQLLNYSPNNSNTNQFIVF